MKGWVIALVAMMMLVPAPGMSREGAPREKSVFSLEQWARETRYKSVKPVQGGYEIQFMESDAMLHGGGWYVYVVYANDSRNWITVDATVIQRGKGFTYPVKLKDWCLSHNQDYAGAKFCYDTKYGAIDAAWEVRARYASTAMIDEAVQDVLYCADHYCDQLLKMLAE